TDQQGGLQRTGLITHLAITSKALTLSSREKKRSSLIKISFSLLLIFRKNDKKLITHFYLYFTYAHTVIFMRTDRLISCA
ncbi:MULTISPECIES: hypothetical protein, partial [Enterobacteriaceae]